ncbi:methyltransferase domain-containing protein [Embleya sp. NPDC008237]|uniref:methyltransferase domain-containing protein n=1 Tax=Embleya sp. NPDC008237 TaxID=3363978 RepID=UPI0036F0404C
MRGVSAQARALWRARVDLLRQVEETVGELPQVWREAFLGVPRHVFLPDLVWLRRPDGDRHERCERVREPKRWWAAAYADVPVVVQMCDGGNPRPDGPHWPSSSASQPSIVAATLLALEVADGHRVLEIGTGTGWNAGLLAHRLRDDQRLVTIEVDPHLARIARTRLAALGRRPTVVWGDGAEGWATGAPYDRVLSTAAVTHIPPAWIRQCRPGAVIVTPWATAWTANGTLVATVDAQGRAQGRFRAGGAFMHLRGHRSRISDVDEVVSPEHVATPSTTAVSPWDVAGGNLAAEFAIGLMTPGVWQHWDENPDVDGVHTRLWVGDEAGTSWASVDYDGRRLDTFAVHQHGPRRLWNEVEAAWSTWCAADRPGMEAFGWTVSADGTQGARVPSLTDAFPSGHDAAGPSWSL